jgi:hypothetical protein
VAATSRWMMRGHFIGVDGVRLRRRRRKSMTTSTFSAASRSSFMEAVNSDLTKPAAPDIQLTGRFHSSQNVLQ